MRVVEAMYPLLPTMLLRPDDIRLVLDCCEYNM